MKHLRRAQGDRDHDCVTHHDVRGEVSLFCRILCMDCDVCIRVTHRTFYCRSVNSGLKLPKKIALDSPKTADSMAVSREVVEFRRACLMCDMVGFDPWRTLSNVECPSRASKDEQSVLDGRSAIDSHSLGPKPQCAWSHYLAACTYLCNHAAAASWG